MASIELPQAAGRVAVALVALSVACARVVSPGTARPAGPLASAVPSSSDSGAAPRSPASAQARDAAAPVRPGCEVAGEGPLFLTVSTSDGPISLDVSAPFIVRPAADKQTTQPRDSLWGESTRVDVLGPPLRLTASSVTQSVLRTRRIEVPSLGGALPAGLVVKRAVLLDRQAVRVSVETIQGDLELDVSCEELGAVGSDQPSAATGTPPAGAVWHFVMDPGGAGIALLPAPGAPPVAHLTPTPWTSSAVERLEDDGPWARVRLSLADDAALVAWVSAEALAPGAQVSRSEFGMIGLFSRGRPRSPSSPRAARLRKGAPIRERPDARSAPWAHATIDVPAVVVDQARSGWWRLMKIDGVKIDSQTLAPDRMPAWVHTSDVELREAPP